MAPAHQRLDAGHGAALQRDARLVVQEELLALDAAAQARFHRQALERAALGDAAVELVVVLARLLGAVHRGIRVLHERLLVLAVLRIEADADARGEEELALADHHRLHERGEHLARRDFRLRAFAHLGEHDHELVAAQARHHVARAQRVAQPPRRLIQHGVARLVAERVVDHLEAVEVDEHHGERALVAPRALASGVQELAERRAVRQPGERVVAREVADAPLVELARRDVAPDAAVADELARGVEHRLAADARPRLEV